MQGKQLRVCPAWRTRLEEIGRVAACIDRHESIAVSVSVSVARLYRKTYGRLQGLGKSHPDFFITESPGCKMEDCIWRILGNLLQELLDSVGFGGKVDGRCVTSIQIDAFQGLQAACVLDQEWISCQFVDKPGL